MQTNKQKKENKYAFEICLGFGAVSASEPLFKIIFAYKLVCDITHRCLLSVTMTATVAALWAQQFQSAFGKKKRISSSKFNKNKNKKNNTRRFECILTKQIHAGLRRHSFDEHFHLSIQTHDFVSHPHLNTVSEEHVLKSCSAEGDSTLVWNIFTSPPPCLQHIHCPYIHHTPGLASVTPNVKLL